MQLMNITKDYEQTQRKKVRKKTWTDAGTRLEDLSIQVSNDM